MVKFTPVDGLVAPLDRDNVDTDAIIPKEFMKAIGRTGFGQNLFDAWRYLDEGRSGRACEGRPLRSEFVLNQPRYEGASILLARRNFGCGSSREHAIWALSDFGFRVIVAISFADIFAGNCLRGGLLVVSLQEAIIERLFAEVAATPGYRLRVDLEQQRVSTPSGEAYLFDIDPFRKYCLLEGLDEIGLTLRHAAAIRGFEQMQRELRPWMFAKAK